MSWEIKHKDYAVYKRNPIVQSVVELRFHPVLEVTQDKAKLSRFQEAVRVDFPVYSERRSQNVAIEAPSNVHISEETNYLFSKVDASQNISISQSNLLLTTLNHVDKEQIKAGVGLALLNLEKVYGACLPIRLGVRYTNIINKAQIESEVGQALAWSDLVADYFFRTPDNLNAKRVMFRSHIQSSLSDEAAGGLSLQYGVHSMNQNTGEIDAFMVDIDRYLENPKPHDIVSYIDSFALDIFSIFEDVAGNKLLEWMSK